MDADLSELQASFLLDFISKELAPLAYNKGKDDAKHFLMTRIDDMDDACFEEKFSFWNKKRNNR